MATQQIGDSVEIQNGQGTSTPDHPRLRSDSNLHSNLESRFRGKVNVKNPPLGLKWRSSYWFTTFVVALGIGCDLVVYSVIIPVMPFQLERRHYSNISALTGWLIFAYSIGLVLSTMPIAMFSERYSARRTPLILGLLTLLGSQVMLMEAPNYPIMCIARVLQGISSSVVWVVGLALLCDSTPEAIVGRQLGIAMTGMSVGLLIGPPAGGLLFNRFGFRGPILFGIVFTALDLVGRLLLIERKDAMKWGFDPAAPILTNPADSTHVEGGLGQTVERKEGTPTSNDPTPETENARVSNNIGASPPPPLSLVAVVIKLISSRRALAAFCISIVYGLVYSSQEPSIPLHLADVWGLDPGKVGLVFLASVIPTLFSSPLTGYFSDHNGTEWVTFWMFTLALPWWIVVSIDGPLALFISAYAIESFFTSGLVSPLTAELAAVSRDIEGVGYGHVYGAFTLAYGIGTSVGPIAGGQMYDHLKRGWAALCYLVTGLLVVCEILAFVWTGSNPLYTRVSRRLSRGRSSHTGSTT